jgi:hypothetical protein
MTLATTSNFNHADFVELLMFSILLFVLATTGRIFYSTGSQSESLKAMGTHARYLRAGGLRFVQIVAIWVLVTDVYGLYAIRAKHEHSPAMPVFYVLGAVVFVGLGYFAFVGFTFVTSLRPVNLVPRQYRDSREIFEQ